MVTSYHWDLLDRQLLQKVRALGTYRAGDIDSVLCDLRNSSKAERRRIATWYDNTAGAMVGAI